MKKIIYVSALLVGLLTACSPSEQKGHEGQIDVLPAFENLTELKVSQLGKNIRYVPLETTDSSLIGAAYSIQLLEDGILVSYGGRTQAHCYLFDRETGKFIREIGHKGEDPKGYSGPKAYVHPVTGHLYFQRNPNKLMKYNQNGEFLGEVVMPNGISTGFYPSFNKEGMLVYEGPSLNSHKRQLYYLDEVKGKTGDITLPIVPNDQQSNALNPSEIQGISVWSGGIGKYGLLSYSGIIEMSLKNGTEARYPGNYPATWPMEDGFRLYEAFTDTIYHVNGQALEPYLAFNLGDRRHPEEERGKKDGNEDKLTMTYVLETEGLIYFQCAKNLYGDFQVYNGLYRKADQTVVMNKVQEAFADDLTHFLPFAPMTHTPKGEFAGALSIEQIQAWQEEHPDAKLEGVLAPLKDLDFDANPVVVIVEP